MFALLNLVPVVAALFVPGLQDGPPAVQFDLSSLTAQLLALGGFAALSSALINAGKQFGLIKDGQAPTVSLAINAVGLIVLVIMNLFRPETDITAADGLLETVAQILVYVLSFVAQIGVAKVSNIALQGTPVVGFSYRLEAEKRFRNAAAQGR